MYPFKAPLLPWEVFLAPLQGLALQNQNHSSGKQRVIFICLTGQMGELRVRGLDYLATAWSTHRHMLGYRLFLVKNPQWSVPWCPESGSWDSSTGFHFCKN